MSNESEFSGYKEAYEKTLKENTKLHAEKVYITNSAARNIKQADQIIQALDDALHRNIDAVKNIVQLHFAGSPSLHECLVQIEQTRPLRIAP